MSRKKEQQLRAEIVEMAKRCERWAADARREADVGRTGAAITLFNVCRHFSSVAFTAAASLSELKAARLARANGVTR